MPSRRKAEHTPRTCHLSPSQAAEVWGRDLYHYEWSHFVTLTPHFPDYSAERLTRGFRDGFIRRLAHVIQGPIPWFCAHIVGATVTLPDGGTFTHLLTCIS